MTVTLESNEASARRSRHCDDCGEVVVNGCRGTTLADQVTCSIALRDVQVLADVGVYHHEIGRPQPLVVHVDLDVIPPGHDGIDDVFDYVRIKAMAEELALERIVLIETFARRMAAGCLASRLVTGASVTVEKPQGVPGSMASATIRMGERAAVGPSSANESYGCRCRHGE